MRSAECGMYRAGVELVNTPRGSNVPPQFRIPHSTLRIWSSLVLPHELRDFFRRHALDEVVVDEHGRREPAGAEAFHFDHRPLAVGDRKSTRLNSSHGYISYAVFCLKKKKLVT